MLASPGRVVRSKRRPGSALRRVAFGPPSWRTVIFGLNGSEKQLTAWNGEEKLAGVPWSPMPSEATEKGLQLVGLIMKFGRSMLTWIERIRIGIPPMMLGTVSESATTWASFGSMWRATRTTTVAVVVGTGQRRGDRHQRERGALERARQEDPSDRVERVPAGSGGDVRGADFRARAGSSGPACSVRPSVCAAAAIDASGQ